MRTAVPEKLLKIIEEIDERGNVNLTKLTVLKKWFECSERLSAFAIWIARRAVARKGKTSGPAGEFFREAKTLLTGADEVHPEIVRQAAAVLHDRLRDFQNEYREDRWGRIRIVHHWNLVLVEYGLAIYLWHSDSPTRGYKLAADYCQNYDPRYGNGLNGPSRTKIGEIVRFMFTLEALEERQE
jgi:hypothetical protein